MSIELKILDFIRTLHTPVLDKIMVGITRLGDAGIIWIILTAIFLVIPKTRRNAGGTGCTDDTVQCDSQKSVCEDKTV